MQEYLVGRNLGKSVEKKRLCRIAFIKPKDLGSKNRKRRKKEEHGAEASVS